MKKRTITITFGMMLGLELLLLFLLTPANAYYYAETQELFIPLGSASSSDSFSEGVLDTLSWFFSIPQFGLVSAQDLTPYCCLSTFDGQSCVDYPSNVIEQNCAPGDIQYTSCEQVSTCQVGCCQDGQEGVCSPQTTKGQCDATGGTWSDDSACGIPECQKGCCVLGDNFQFVTEDRCTHLSGLYGYVSDFRSAGSELECLALSPTLSLEQGACVFEDGLCRRTDLRECTSLGGDFSQGLLCSDDSLETTCTRQADVGCVEGKDEIYWFDSCGNQENIYSADRTASYGEGSILAKAQSCNPDSGNTGSSTCGNCNYLLGSTCSPTTGSPQVRDGAYVCQDLACVDSSGNSRQNGESWCEYDGYIGEGKDTVGSRHWQYKCVDGDVIPEPCADYRGEICVEDQVKTTSGVEISTAACTINRAMQCLQYNEDPNTMKEQCAENSDCVLTEVDVSSTFQFDLCTGQYPRGFDLLGQDSRSQIDGQICDYADQTCKVVYQKKLSGNWECVANCECEDKEFAQEMNNLCVALGDCGSYVNYIGEGTDNIKVKNAPEVKWQEYTQYAEVVVGQHADPDDLESILQMIGQASGDQDTAVEQVTAMISTMGQASGAVGSVILLAAKLGFSWATVTTTTYSASSIVSGIFTGQGFSTFAGGGGLTGFGTPVTSIAPTAAAFAGAAIGAGIGAFVGGYVADAMGLTGQGAMLMTIGGALAGAGVGLILFGQGSIITILGAGIGPIGLVIGLAIMAVTALLGIGKTKTVKVRFDCQPWQAPAGGENCGECNDDPLKPCSDYRCSSLGQACELINKDSTQPTCVAIEDDDTYPALSPGEVFTEGYRFSTTTDKDVAILTEGGTCIDAYESVVFSLDLSERAQCQYGFDRSHSFADMPETPASGNYYYYNHTFAFSAPSIHSLQALGLEITGDIKEQYADMTMYVHCQDLHGDVTPLPYAVDICVSSGPDITAPQIVTTLPENPGFFAQNTSALNVSFYLNEPAECRYSLTPGSTYWNKTGIMECETEVNAPTARGWECVMPLSDMSENETKYYVKCLDKPWLDDPELNVTDPESERISNEEDYVYTLTGTKEALVIDVLSPSGTITAGTAPQAVTLELETTGGISSGASFCSYRFFDDAPWIGLLTSGGAHHEQQLTLLNGTYNISIQCIDPIGNTAQTVALFALELDSTPPGISRVYESGGQLTVVTTEDARCVVDYTSCLFPFANGTQMDSAYTREHTLPWDRTKTYHVVCEDIWNNKNAGCAVRVRPGFSTSGVDL